MSCYVKSSRRKGTKNKHDDVFYILFFVAMAVLIIGYVFCLPVKGIEDKQKSENIGIAESLVENELNVDKKSYDIQLYKSDSKEFLNKWTGENVKCFVFTKGKRYEVVFETKLVNGLNKYEIVGIKKMVEL